MKPEDVPQVAELESQTFSQPWSEKGFLDSLQLPNTIFLAACDGQEVVGYAGMYLSVDEGEIVNVAVAQKMRRKGIGDALLDKMAECAAQKTADAEAASYFIQRRRPDALSVSICGRRNYAERRKDHIDDPNGIL